MFEGLSLKASGNIFPSRFIKLSGENTAVFASATTDFLIGVSHESIEDSLGVHGSSTYHRTSSSPLGVEFYGPLRQCLLEAGATYSAGALLTTDTVGRGVGASSGNFAGALAIEAATAVGQLARVLVIACTKA